MGLVSQVFDENDLGYLPGTFAIGHTRYSTTGASRAENAQPFRVWGRHGELALGHNGNIVNANEIREELVDEGDHLHDGQRQRSDRAGAGQRPGRRLERALGARHAPAQRVVLPGRHHP